MVLWAKYVAAMVAIWDKRKYPVWLMLAKINGVFVYNCYASPSPTAVDIEHMLTTLFASKSNIE